MNVRHHAAVAASLAATLLAGAALAEPIWSYDEATGAGPTAWGSLSEDYALCSSGLGQSPIDLAGATRGRGFELGFDYEPTELVIENNARTIEVVYESGSMLRVGGRSYELLQFHFHTPSEHQIGGREEPLEAHFVHRSADGELAVVGVLIREGEANAALERILANAPEEEGEVHVPGEYVSADELMPEERHGYRRYTGSLTTPPCSEGVRWMVLAQTITASTEQVLRLREILAHVQHFPYNARPIQPDNGRRVVLRVRS
jgi:carbonic anhydrase